MGVLAVLLGAFGAHGLKPHLSADQVDTYQTGIFYHFIHVLAMLALITLSGRYHENRLRIAFYAFLIGIFMFSGSIYLLACKDLLELKSFVKVLGPITPLGGLCFIFGWIMLILAAQKRKE
ncbi:MAG: DUF423 domain-containing protein [Bacteroidota bacterium]